MVKTFAPAMSLDATGTVADAMTFSKWKGRNYLRKRSTPSNPRSGLQVGGRAMFSFLTKNWNARSAAEQASWGPPATARTISTFNAFLAENVQRWKRFFPPGTTYPIGDTGTVGTQGFLQPQVTGGVRSATISDSYSAINQNWGLLIFRGPFAFPTSVSTLVQVLLADVVSTTYTWLETDLEPGTHYYNFRSFTLDGVLGPEIGQKFAIVTA